MKAEKTLDISNLPTSAFGNESPLWWGNTLLLLIETTVLILLLASYFYIRINYYSWPPPRIDRVPHILHPFPDLLIPTTNMIIMLASIIPAVWFHRAALRLNQPAVNFGLALFIVFGIAAIILRFYEYPALKLRWDDNAYGSVTWTILGAHMMHLFIATAEGITMGTWSFTRRLDEKHALDITLTAIYWYWVVGIWIIFYVLIYWIPRLM